MAQTPPVPVAQPPELDDSPPLETNEWAFEEPEIESDVEDEPDAADDRPRVKIPKELRREPCREWQLALIIKYLGKNINFNVLNQRLPNIWGLQGHLHLIDIGYGFFVARFDNKTDYLHVLLDGPWKIFDNYLVAQRWQPEFKPKTAKISKMAVWVRLPDLHVEYFREDVVKLILMNVGKPLKLGRLTTSVAKGRFARAAVEIDVDKPLVSEIWVRNSIQTVEYEGLHVVCFGCGVVGHREQACPVNNPKAPETSDMDLNEANGPNAEPQQTATTPSSSEGTTQRSRKYGTWMLVTIKPKKVDQTNYNHQKKFYANVHKFALPTRGNQFEALGILKTRMCLLQPHRGRTNQLRSPARDPKGSKNKATRGKGRGPSRGGSNGVADGPNFMASSAKLERPGVFQFGSTSREATTNDQVPPNQSGEGTSSRFTPGESGGQTSPSALSSQ
ncbi:uncharacterized protein LOC116013176 [Ipomoea triloba]|uniref:uncharacterized protein LOC116013176 n=1 Tax=Ipomoea triloba TaxID=35885 RepID=UPI00125E1A41|nr:uncharacterized protein LOC116013176 [Ipomoea triloba]